jgi:hypothetical protein
MYAKFMMQPASRRDKMVSRESNLVFVAMVIRMAPPNIELDKSKFEVFESFAAAEIRDRNYWLAKTPIERLASCELLRQITYGYDPATARLPRSFEILKRGEG